ncbi:MAG TPA: ATP-binding cassette domain-containing protein [Thermoanaerobaculia bacterium]|nr:ATP-binding cassette domain-containing protein [Thermoanaerobaculia bacterium]
MLEVSLHAVSFAYPQFALRDITLTFAASTNTAIVGTGSSTLLNLIAGKLRPRSGEIQIGARVVNDLSQSRRPLLYVTSAIDVPARWSVRHALIAAVRRRTLDRVDRQHEYELAVDKWKLGTLVERRIASLSDSEKTLVHLARIELLRPGILVADRLLAAATEETTDAFYRTLRVSETTVIGAPASRAELGATDRVVVLADGRVVQEGTAAQIYAKPLHEAAAIATGEVNVVPVTISGQVVESVIGTWKISNAPFQGPGIALVRPEAFSLPATGAESDLIVGVEEASFENGRWIIRAILSGGFMLRASLPGDMRLHKGKLLPLIYDADAFSLLQRDIAQIRLSAPTDIIPSLNDSR